MEELQVFRSQIRNLRPFVVDGDALNAKGVSYPIDVNNMQSFTDAELEQAVNDKKSVGVPTGRLSEAISAKIQFDSIGRIVESDVPTPKLLVDYEYDLYREDSLGSEQNASYWIAKKTSKLESLGTIVLKSPRSGIHVLAFASFVYRNSAIDDWLFTLEELDERIYTDVIHFDSPSRPHYVILPNAHNGRSFVGKCRTIKRFN